ncbi:MAG: LCP family protein [Acetanaerobacterium sp.]
MKRTRIHRIKLFSISFGVSVVVLSLIFIPIMLELSPLHDNYFSTSSVAESVDQDIYTPVEKDAMTSLIIVTDGGSGRYFMLIRFDPINERIPVCSLPYTMQVVTSERTDTLAGFDAYGGTLMVREILQSALKITIDRTARLSTDDFVKAVNTLGTVKYTLPYSLIYKDTGTDTYINVPKGTQTLDGRAVYDMFRFPQYAEGEEHRYKVQSDLLAKLINERLNDWLIQHGDSVFNTIVNLADTDISYNDYQQRLAALRRFAEREEGASIPIFPGGRYDTQSFTLSQQSADTLRMYFVGEQQSAI